MSIAYHIFNAQISLSDISKTKIEIKTTKKDEVVFGKDNTWGHPEFREDGSLKYIVFYPVEGNSPAPILSELHRVFNAQVLDEWFLAEYSQGIHGTDFQGILDEASVVYFGKTELPLSDE